MPTTPMIDTYRNLGRTDLRISPLCLGSVQFGWSTDEATSFEVMDAFVEVGGNIIDTADIYSSWAPGNPGGVSEEIIGRWMKERNNRHELVVATKGRGPMWDGPDGEGLSRAHLTRAVDDSLRRLQTDYIDLYQTHWPDPSTPLEETLSTLDELVKAGKIRYIGCSNVSAVELQTALAVSEREDIVRYECVQPHYNLAHRSEYEMEVRDVCAHGKLGVISYSPLAGGFLTGKYRRGAPVPESTRAQSVQAKYFNERGWRIIDALDQVAERVGAPVPQVALAWVIAQPTISAPIIGANSVEQVHDHLRAATLTLDSDTLQLLNDASSE